MRCAQKKTGRFCLPSNGGYTQQREKQNTKENQTGGRVVHTESLWLRLRQIDMKTVLKNIKFFYPPRIVESRSAPKDKSSETIARDDGWFREIGQFRQVKVENEVARNKTNYFWFIPSKQLIDKLVGFTYPPKRPTLFHYVSAAYRYLFLVKLTITLYHSCQWGSRWWTNYSLISTSSFMFTSFHGHHNLWLLFSWRCLHDPQGRNMRHSH